MYACKMIREDGYFHKAIEAAADYYGVDEKEIEKHVRARQAAGQKGVAAGRKYKYYISIPLRSNDAGYFERGFPRVIRASSLENAEKHFDDSDFDRTIAEDYGGSYAFSYYHQIIGNKDGYTSKSDAEADRSRALNEFLLINNYYE